MMRIHIDSQSAPVFRGSALEQAYSFRGGLCQMGERDIVVVPGRFEPTYLAYWRDTIGLPLPRITEVDPKGTVKTITQLLLEDASARQNLVSSVNGSAARLEFFCLSDEEKELAASLNIPVYADFSTAISLSRKGVAKRFWRSIGISTPDWIEVENAEALKSVRTFVENGPVFIKSDLGTGGTACGGACVVDTPEEFLPAVETLSANEAIARDRFVVEKMVAEARTTLSVHWEKTLDGTLTFMGMYTQFGVNNYCGVEYPAAASQELQNELHEDVRRIDSALGHTLGYFCGDVVIDERGGRHWVDFNPRKGAISYIRDAVYRIRERYGIAPGPFVHRHTKLSWLGHGSFQDVATRLGTRMIPNADAFIVVTNPGVIPFGYVDLTAIASESHAAHKALDEALSALS